MDPGDVVLVDTNVIIEGHLRRCWDAVAGAYKLETAERCVIEALTGRHDWNGRRPPEGKLRRSFHAIHPVSPIELAEIAIRGGSGLDAGEQALWANALARKDVWILCGPDRASMRFGYEQGERERLVSLGALLRRIKFVPSTPIRAHFDQAWLDDVINKLILGLV